LDNIFVWWLWVALGIIIAGLEILTGDFLLLGIGLSAVTIGIIDKYLNLTLFEELILMSILTLLYILIWKEFVNDRVKGTKYGQSDEGIGEIGVIIEPITDLEEGRVEFRDPVIGSKVWIATSKKPIEVGTRVKLIKIIGQIAEVIPYEGD
jgi:membrane protein implicated in regulation of membrane protease activity